MNISKKIIMISLLITLVMPFCNKAEENSGIGEIIFEQSQTADTTVLHSDSINELSYKVIQIHMVLAGKTADNLDYAGETLTVIKTLEELTKTNIIALLNISDDKQKALSDYLNDCDRAIQKGSAVSLYIKQEMELLKSDMESCLKEKKLSNTEYFEAIDIYDQDTMNASRDNAIAYETCAVENRIYYNAQASIMRKLVFYLGLLQNKYDVLYEKQDIVAKNYDIFRDNILPDLNQIDVLLQQYTF